MNCNAIDERLDDYVDGTLPEGECQEIELHVASCAACQQQERQLRWLLDRAQALPQELQPGRDLWAGIATRIEAERRARPGWWAPLGLAAAAVLVIGVALSQREHVLPRPGPVAFGTPVSYERSAMGGAEQEYERAATTLMAALEERRDTLSPETLASVRKNMEVIDGALAEVRAALQHDPGNSELTRMLVATHRKKVDTLRRVVRLSKAI
jgi:Putative zinc-finger